MADRRSLPQVKDAVVRIALAGDRAGDTDGCTTAMLQGLVQEAYDGGRESSEGLERITHLTPAQAGALLRWLVRPHGQFAAGRVTFELTGDGLLVRTRAYRPGQEIHGLDLPPRAGL